jgi:hypothetical protein
LPPDLGLNRSKDAGTAGDVGDVGRLVAESGVVGSVARECPDRGAAVGSWESEPKHPESRVSATTDPTTAAHACLV